jgi:hypothetical protein
MFIYFLYTPLEWTCLAWDPYRTVIIDSLRNRRDKNHGIRSVNNNDFIISDRKATTVIIIITIWPI